MAAGVLRGEGIHHALHGVVGNQCGTRNGRRINGQDQHQALSSSISGTALHRGPKPRKTMVRGSSSSSVSKSRDVVAASGRVIAACAPPHRPVQLDVQAAVRKVFHPVPAPLHHRHGRVHGVFEVDVVDFGGGPQPVGIDVDQVRTAGPRSVRQVGVDAYQHERRGNDACTDAQAFAQSLGERGLACTQFAGQDQEVPGLKYPTQGCREGVRLLRRRDLQRPFPRGLVQRVSASTARSPGIRPPGSH